MYAKLLAMRFAAVGTNVASRDHLSCKTQRNLTYRVIYYIFKISRMCTGISHVEYITVRTVSYYNFFFEHMISELVNSIIILPTRYFVYLMQNF